MKMEIPAEVLNLMDLLYEHGYECFVIGGAVRDALLGRPVHDYDLTTNALPKEMLKIFRKKYPVIPTGLKHGTVTVVSGDMPVEITTYRADSGYSDHRHPDEVTFTRSLREDCARRDFTINALCYSPVTGFSDFFDGVTDLHNGIIRCIGRPHDRLDEDALRILRAIRFAARFRFTIDPETSQALFDQKDTLVYVSAERIKTELTGFLQAPACGMYLCRYRSIFEVFLPELNTLDEEALQQAGDAIDRCAPDTLIRTALLFKDLADPDAILRRLTFSNAERETVMDLIRNRDLPLATRTDLRRCLNQLSASFDAYTEFRCILDPSLDRESLLARHAAIQRDGDCYTLKALAVNGTDVRSLGFTGKMIGIALHKALDAVMTDTIPNEKDRILSFLSSEFHSG